MPIAILEISTGSNDQKGSFSNDIYKQQIYQMVLQSSRIFNLKDKFITPRGVFKTKKEIQKVVGIPEWTLNTIYSNLDAYPIINGRASKKINHLNIDPNKTWRNNGFGLLAVS